ncbi:MAG: hypothetical protein ACOH18_05000 [Candidatus Saccharimonadaceae bacterium]
MQEDQEATHVALKLDSVHEYFEKGVRLVFWESYLVALEEATKTKKNLELPKEVPEKYQEIVTILYNAHTRHIGEEIDPINSLLTDYPGVIVKDSEGHIQLLSVDTLHVALTETDITLGQSPVRQIVTWSDGTSEERDEPIPLFVDMTALPESFSKNLNKYRTLNGISLTD